MEMLFSVGSAMGLYNEDHMPAESNLRIGSLRSWQLQDGIGLTVPEEIAGRQFCTRIGEGMT
jgi:hypothetical protein